METVKTGRKDSKGRELKWGDQAILITQMRLNVGLDQSNSSRDEEKWSASLQYERGLIGFASGLNV